MVNRSARQGDGLMERFWSKCVMTGGGCWLWTAATNEYGYGQFKIDGGMKLAHRIAWRLKHGHLPEELCVLHVCDTPACVNPDHLFLGTQVDNVADRNAKGRQAGAAGIKNRHAKLTESDVIRLRWLAARGLSYAVLGKRFGISGEQASAVARRKSWRHIGLDRELG